VLCYGLGGPESIFLVSGVVLAVGVVACALLGMGQVFTRSAPDQYLAVVEE